MRMFMALSMLVAALLMPALSHASNVTLETSHLTVSDRDNHSDEQLRELANYAQETLNKVLAFWSADPGIDQFGKIRIIFEPPFRGNYFSVFYWDRKDGRQIRAVRVAGSAPLPQMLAHKLASAVFPQNDKLIRNMMGIVTENQLGNRLTFPGCGFSDDEWVLAFLRMKSVIPLNELGPDHESWGMRDYGGGNIRAYDIAKQLKSYAEAGSFSQYLVLTYGINKLKQLHELSSRQKRPWQEVYEIGLQELEANWLKALAASEKAKSESIATLSTLFASNANTACLKAQEIVLGKQ